MNPTCSARMEKILEAAMATHLSAVPGARSSECRSVTSKAAVPGPVPAVEDLTGQLQSMKLVPNPVMAETVLCTCTRKCKTKLCPCFLQGLACNSKCHANNNNCTNRKSK